MSGKSLNLGINRIPGGDLGHILGKFLGCQLFCSKFKFILGWECAPKSELIGQKISWKKETKKSLSPS